MHCTSLSMPAWVRTPPCTSTPFWTEDGHRAGSHRQAASWQWEVDSSQSESPVQPGAHSRSPGEEKRVGPSAQARPPGEESLGEHVRERRLVQELFPGL